VTHHQRDSLRRDQRASSGSMEGAALAPGTRVRIERTDGVVEGTVLALSDASMTLAHADGPGSGVEIPWSAVARVSVRHGRPRSYAPPVGLGLTGALVFGACGGVLDSLATPSSGPARSNLFGSSAAIGLLLGAAIGLLMIFGRRGPEWVAVLDAPDPAHRTQDMPLAARLASGRPDSSESSSRARVESMRVWLLLLALLIGGWQWFRWYLRH
jgi:hypothetical protein